jgi:hypothetical protein
VEGREDHRAGAPQPKCRVGVARAGYTPARMARTWLLLVSLLALSLPAFAAPDVRVMLLQTDGGADRSAFLDALQIQLARKAIVSTGPELPAGPSSTRIERVARIIAMDGVKLAVWVDAGLATEDGSREFVLYAVGREQDTTVVRTARVHGVDGPEINRALALKVGELLDASPPLAVQDAGQPQIATQAQGGEGIGLVLELGLVGAMGAGSDAIQSGLLAAFGASWQSPRWRGEGYAAFRWMADSEFEAPAGHADVSEVALSVGARVLLGRGRLVAGGHVELGARLLDASGMAADGRDGGAWRAVPTLLGGAELRLALVAPLSLRAAAGVELALIHQRFAFEGSAVADFGRIRPTASLSLVLAAP